MTSNHDYATPEEGSLDWHIPLNDNFQAIDRDVEIRDTASNRGNYTPKSGAKFLATDTLDVYLGDGSDWNLAGSIGGTSDGTSLTSALAGGNVVAAGAGTERYIDRTGTNTPLQDAIDAIAAGDGSGIVYLPPGKTQDAGPITVPSDAQGLHIQGTGISTDADSARNCVLEITGSNVGMDVSGWGWKFASMDGFTLKGTNQSKPAIRFSGNVNPRMFNIGRMRFQGWDASGAGVLDYADASPFSCHFDTLMFARSNTGACINFDQKSPIAVKISNMYPDHGSADPVIDCQGESPSMIIDLCNVGGHHDRVLNLASMTSNGYMQVNWINYEPSTLSQAETICKLGGRGYCYLPHIVINGYSELTDIDQAVDLAYKNGNNVIGQIQNKGNVSVSNNLINVTKTPGDYSWYYGPSSDVTDSSGSSTGKVRALASAGDGNA